MRDLDHPAAGLFPGLSSEETFLNAAYMTPKPASALAAMHAAIERYGNPDFGAEDFFDPPERVRALLADVVGGSAASYSLVGAVSFGVATLTWNLRARAEELVGARRRLLAVDGQFPSNVQGWRRLAEVGFELELVAPGPEATEALLARLDAHTALLAIEPLSWTDGARLDLAALLRAAREAGALSLVDVTQSAGVDAPLAAEDGPDLVVGAGYKWLLGPYGTGFLRLTPHLQEILEPLEASWKNFAGARDFNRLTEYRPEALSAAARFDHGQSSAFVRLAGWSAGLEVLRELGPGAVAEHTRKFARELVASLDSERYVWAEPGTPAHAAHLFRIAPREARDFQARSAELAAAGLRVSQRDGGWRLSPHVYNGPRDLARSLEAFA